MSPAAIHLQSPIKSSTDTTSHPSFNADVLNPSTARGRSRPRLVKLRKQSARSRGRTTAAGEESSASSSGFNPFRSDQVTGSFSRAESGDGANDGGCGSENPNRHRGFGREGFVFTARNRDSGSARDLNSEQGSGEEESECRKGESVEFVFCAKRSDVESVSPREGGEKSSEREEHGEFDSAGFVFSAGGSNLASSSNVEMGKTSLGVGNSGLVDDDEERGSKDEVAGDKNGSSKTSSVNMKQQESVDGLRNSTHGVGVFSTTVETNPNCDKDADQCDDDKCKSAFESISAISALYSDDIPADKITDEMKKLNINHSEGVDTTRDSMNSFVNSSASFVFGGSDKVFGCVSDSSGVNLDGTDADLDNIGGKHVKACRENDVQNEIGCGSAGIPCTEPSTSQEGARDFQGGKIPECCVSEESQVNGAAAPFTCSSCGLDSHPNYASMGHSSSADNEKCNNCFASSEEASKESFTDFKPPTWDPSCFRENLFPKLNKKLESTPKSRFSKGKGSKCLGRKLKPHSLNKKQTDHLSKESSPLQTPGSSGSLSPMDFSPYQEIAADDQDVKAAEELNDLHSKISTDNKKEHLETLGREGNNTTAQRCGDLDSGKSSNGSSAGGDAQYSGPEMVWPNMKTEQFSSSRTCGALADAGFDFTLNSDKQKPGGLCFVHGPSDSKKKDFTFSASSTVEGTSSSFKRKQKKKFRRKVGCDSFVISPNLNGKFASSVQSSPLITANISSHSDVMDRSQINDQFEERGGAGASSATIEEACYKWRLRGNHAHKDGDLSKAEAFYTQGINSVPSCERSGCCLKPLLLCYSNRAATRMSLGRIREALEDCMMVTSLDPTFVKIQLRTANCHLLLGEIENALQCYNKCLESGNVVCLDRRVIVEAAEGLQKAQEVVKCMNDAAERLKDRNSNATGSALKLLTKALSISLYSEKLLQMKAEALYLLQKYEDAIQLCEQSQCLAEKNLALANSANKLNGSMFDSYSSVKLWRWSLISKCYFHLGKLEASLNVLDKLQQVATVNDKCSVDNVEDLLSLAATIRELQALKSAGNENFKLGKYTEAVENYTVALSSNVKSRPFTAICFCNRAAAYQALGQITDAIADCSMAMALNGNYAKAISRRASLHVMVRDYEQAACDFRSLISVLETQSNEKAKQSNSPSGSNGGKESRQAHQRLLSVEEQAKKGTALDFYLILGIKPDDTASDIKKAYHKAALRHHPDKAGQLLARSEVGDEGRVWKEISQEVHKDADRLFKMIGEAYAVLSDPAKRSEYDLDEEIRKASEQVNRGGTCRRSPDVFRNGRQSEGYKSPFDKTYYRRYGQDHWRTYGQSYSRW